MTKWAKAVLVGAILVALTGSNATAQSIFATLTGVVADPSQAVVPQAKVTLKNESSGDQRTTVTNSEGYFTFASVVVGATYEITIKAPGFLPYKATGAVDDRRREEAP